MNTQRLDIQGLSETDNFTERRSLRLLPLGLPDGHILCLSSSSKIPYSVPDCSSIMPLYSVDGLLSKPPSSTYAIQSTHCGQMIALI